MSPVGWNLTGLVYNGVLGKIDKSDHRILYLLLEYQSIKSKSIIYASELSGVLNALLNYSGNDQSFKRQMRGHIKELNNNIYPPFKWADFKQELYEKYLQYQIEQPGMTVGKLFSKLKGKDGK